jgi:hypothetical protein
LSVPPAVLVDVNRKAVWHLRHSALSRIITPRAGRAGAAAFAGAKPVPWPRGVLLANPAAVVTDGAFPCEQIRTHLGEPDERAAFVQIEPAVLDSHNPVRPCIPPVWPAVQIAPAH